MFSKKFLLPSLRVVVMFLHMALPFFDPLLLHTGHSAKTLRLDGSLCAPTLDLSGLIPHKPHIFFMPEIQADLYTIWSLKTKSILSNKSLLGWTCRVPILQKIQ